MVPQNIGSTLQYRHGALSMIREFRSLLPLLQKYRWHYAAGLLALLVTSGAQLAIPHFVGHSIDLLVPGSTGLVRAASRPILLLIATAIVVAIGRFGWRYFINGCSRRVETELREKLYNHLLLLPPDYFRSHKTGDLMARATNDMNAIRMAIGIGIVALFDGLFMTIAILIILFGRNPRLAILTVMPLPLITIMIIAVGGRINMLFRRVQEGFSRMSDQVQEVLSGIRVVKAFVKEDFFTQRFTEANQYYQDENMKLVRIWGVFFPLVTFLSGLTILILLFFGGQALIDGSISTGDFVATLSYLQMLIWPMLGAGFTVNMLHRGAASLERINEILSATPGPVEIDLPQEGAPSPGVSIRDLTFHYSADGAAAVQNVSVELSPGETLGILGRTGSGKTTVVNTLVRLVDPPEGTVFVGDVDVRHWELDRLRDRFGVVPQNSFLFSATIANNIRFARPNAADEEIRRAADIAAIREEIEAFPDQWETVVGERGVTLSGGQRQRIAIARALLRDPEVLVLDDSLSAVDTRTEDRILSNLAAERAGKTTIIISNRVSALWRADKILIMEDGRIAQEGTHSSLISQDGLYRDIYALQQIEAGHSA